MNKKKRGKVTSIKLDKMRLELKVSLQEYLLDPEVTIYRDHLFEDRIIAQVKGFLLGEKLPEEVISYPQDWKQAFKERWFPRWLKRKFPVKYMKHHIQFRILYPDFGVALPKQKSKIDLTTWQEGDCT